MRRLSWLGLALATGVAHLALFGPQLVDDAFISFRYAAHFAAGQGLVFNPGEHVEGFSNLLWTVLLAIAAWFRLSLPWTSVALGGLCFLASLVTLWSSLRLAGLPPWVAGLLCTAAAALSDLAGASLTGLETSLYMLGLTLVLLGLVDTRPGRSAWVFAIGVFVSATARAEGMLLAPLLVAMFVALQHRIPRPVWGVVVALACVKLGERWYFGHWLPMSVLAKRDFDVGPIASFLRGLPSGRRYLLDEFGTAWPAFCVASGLLGVIRNRVPRRVLEAVLLPASVYGLIAVMVPLSNKGDWMSFGRLLVPYFPALLAALGLLVYDATLRWFRKPKFASVAFVAWMAIFVVLQTWHRPRRRPVANPLDDLGRLVAADARPGDVVATAVLGRLGYYASSADVVDICGLTDPQVALAPVPGTVYGKERHKTTARLRPEVIVHNARWNLLDIVRLTGVRYSLAVSPALSQADVFVAIRQDALSHWAPALRARFGASFVDTGAIR